MGVHGRAPGQLRYLSTGTDLFRVLLARDPPGTGDRGQVGPGKDHSAGVGLVDVRPYAVHLVSRRADPTPHGDTRYGGGSYRVPCRRPAGSHRDGAITAHY